MRLRQGTLVNWEVRVFDRATNSRGYDEVTLKEVIPFQANLHVKSNSQQSRITGEPDTVMEAYTTNCILRDRKYVNSIVVNPTTGDEFILKNLVPYTKHVVLTLESKV